MFSLSLSSPNYNLSVAKGDITDVSPVLLMTFIWQYLHRFSQVSSGGSLIIEICSSSETLQASVAYNKCNPCPLMYALVCHYTLEIRLNFLIMLYSASNYHISITCRTTSLQHFGEFLMAVF